MGRNNEEFELGKWSEADQKILDSSIAQIMSKEYKPKREGRVENLSNHLSELRKVADVFKKNGTYTPEIKALHAEHVSRSSVPIEAPNGLDSIDYSGILRGNDRHGFPVTTGYEGNDGISKTPVKLDHSACPFCDHSELKSADFKRQPDIQKVIGQSKQFSDQFFASQNKGPEDDVDKEYRGLTNGY